MGQYYVPVVINKDGRKKFDSWDYGSGLKLMEHSWLGNRFVNAVYTAIKDNSSLVGWIGDYSNDVGCDKDLYKYAWSNELGDTSSNSARIKPENLFYNEEEKKVYGEGFLINHSLYQYIDMKEYVEQSEDKVWVINPLPLLTAIGNGQGGGDYRGENMKLVGSWFMDEIEFSMEPPMFPWYSDVTEQIVFKEGR